MSDKNTLGLSRRRVLGGLGAIGVASAGAGLGTSAYFSDTESFTDNILNAGSLDLAVQANVYEYQGTANSGGQSFGGVVDGNDDIQQELDDVKPGDYSWGRFCFSIVDNPAYIWACGELTSNKENGLTEPEGEVDNTGGNPGEGNGELADAIHGCLFYATPDNYDPSAQGRPSETGAPGDVILEGTLREILIALQTGVPLDGSANSGRQPFDGDEQQSFDGDERCLGFWWEVPTTVENEIQTDSLMFDLSFEAVQSRHNDGDANPCVDESYTADYENPDGIDQPIQGGVLKLDVSYGDQLVVYDILFDEPANSNYDLYDPNFASANFSMPFDADDDGIYDFQVAWNAEGGDSFQYSGVNGTPNWEKDTGTGWSALPAGFSASKSGPNATIAVPRTALDGGSDDSYLFGFLASAGGEQPSVSIPDDGPYSSNQNFTSSENGQSTTLQ